MTGSPLRVEAVTKTYAQTAVLRDVSLELEAGSRMALLGPSGSGKSTLLHIIAGLLTPDAGSVHLGDRCLDQVKAEQRPTALVFQKPLLFPHLSVGDNIAFGLRMRGVARAVRVEQVRRALDDVALPGLGDRRISELSGGQEQRVALARALVLTPELLLLDEPFSQLDAGLREEMRELVITLQTSRGLTTVFVTHDRREAALVADTIAVLLDGRLEALAGPQELFMCPPSLQVARFLGSPAELRGVLSAGHVIGAWGSLPCPVPAVGHDGQEVVLLLREEHVNVEASPGATPLCVRVQSVHFAGTHLDVVCELPGHGVLRARSSITGGPQPQVGSPLLVHVRTGSGHVLPADGRR